MREDLYTLVIIGGGPAGLSAAVNASSEGITTAVIDCQPECGGQAKHSSRIENYLGFPRGLSGPALTARAVSQARKFGAEFILGERAVSIEPEGNMKCVKLSSTRVVLCRAVLMACGLEWRKLLVPGCDSLSGKGVFYGASKDDPRRYAGKSVFVIGGANSAGQAAMHFHGAGARTTLVYRGSTLDKMSAYLIERIEHARIDVKFSTEIACLGGSPELEWIELKCGEREERVEAHGVFIFIGAEPRTDWLKDSCIRDERGYIKCDGRNGTDAPGIFVAGDVRSGSVKRIASGVGDGAQAVSKIHEFLERIK